MKDESFDAAFIRVSQIDARVGPSLDDAHDFQSGQRLTDGAPACFEFLREVSFGRQALGGLIAAFTDKRKDFSNGVKRFVFVGSLYELKNVDVTLRALHKAMAGKDFTFDIVGSGAEYDNLRRLVDELGLGDHVVFHGQLKRDDAQEVVRNADCFVMVSSREAFGLAYVEAMAKGCIVIGTIGQGIDGIVTHGENGFLCKARDVDELAEVINQIVNLSRVELQNISSKAVTTAANLTDRKVAEQYINSIL